MSREQTALVSGDHVGRSYVRGSVSVEAVRSADFRVMPGDRIAIVGRSGSGKSTLLYLMAGIEKPTSGSILWPALDPGLPLRPAQVAMVFQSPSLLPSLSVAENVGLPLLLGPGHDKANPAALTALTRIGLADLADKLPEELSGGQAQRVAIARALCAGPKLLLADEPTGQLDRATGQALIDHVLSMLDDQVGLVLATHDLEVARRMKTIWRMSGGRLQQETSLQVAS